MMNPTLSRRSFSGPITGWSAALLAAVALTQSVMGEPVENTGPNTWVGGAGLPIWNLNTVIRPPTQLPGVTNSAPVGEFATNWSFGTLPTSTDNVLFPFVIPTFPNAGEYGSVFSSLTNGQTILLGLIEDRGQLPDPNSLTFQNNYTLMNGSVFAPGSVFFQNGKVTLPVTSGQITVGAGFTATIDVDLLPGNGTITKLGPGSLILNDQVNGNVLIQAGMLGGVFTTTGNLTNFATLSPGDAPGAVHVQGNYLQIKGANLNITIASPTSFDQLLVSGKATLAGNANFSLSNGFLPRKGEKFTFLDAGSISGKFGEVNAPVWDNLTLRLFYGNDSVTAKVVVDSFESVPGLTANEQAVANVIDTLIDNPRYSKIINFLYRQSFSQLAADFDKISPSELSSIYTISTVLAIEQSLNIQRRTNDVRNGWGGIGGSGPTVNGGTGLSYSGPFGINTGVAGPSGDDGKESKEVKNVVPTENRWGAFLSGTGEWVNVSGTQNARGYDLANGGFTLGVDYKVCPNFAVGVMAGYTGTTADLSDHGRVYVNGGNIGLYATVFQNTPPAPAATMSKDSKEVAPPAPSVGGGWYADIAATGGYSSYDTHRSALGGTASGDTDGGNFNALFGTGYDFKSGALTFGPTASFNYTYTGMNGFTEHDSLAPLDIHSGQSDSLRSAFGFKASYDWQLGSMIIKPELSAAWQHEYGDSTYTLVSDFANGGGGNFTAAGPRLGRDSALVGAGFAIQVNERCSTYLYYDGELGRTNYISNSVTGGVRVSF